MQQFDSLTLCQLFIKLNDLVLHGIALVWFPKHDLSWNKKSRNIQRDIII